jgi:glyoxylase-like metal-dependent hydrolase (beta-lactamase superfamily II)
MKMDELVAAPSVKGFYDPDTGSIQYIVSDPATSLCAIIDPVFDFSETTTPHLFTRSADAILAYVAANKLKVQWILDTHLHADHFSASQYIKKATGAKIATSTYVVEAQKIWSEIYNLPDIPTDGSQWDHLFAENESIKIGEISGTLMYSPGHTPASVTYLIGDAAFIHDTLFMPDLGTARADFPGGSAKELWQTIQNIIALPDETRLFTGHDYPPSGREPSWESTVGAQKRTNVHLLAAKTEQEFIQLRETRDRTLATPRLMFLALQVNIRGGKLPAPESNGRRYLKIPLSDIEI